MNIEIYNEEEVKFLLNYLVWSKAITGKCQNLLSNIDIHSYQKIKDNSLLDCVSFTQKIKNLNKKVEEQDLVILMLNIIAKIRANKNSIIDCQDKIISLENENDYLINQNFYVKDATSFKEFYDKLLEFEKIQRLKSK
jgi:hypothetical protein